MYETFYTTGTGHRSDRVHHKTLEKALLAWRSNIERNGTDPSAVYLGSNGFESILQHSENCAALIWKRHDGKATGALIEHLNLPDGLSPQEIADALLAEEAAERDEA